MNEYHAGLIERYRRSGVLLDTNLFLLYLVGSFRRDQIEQFKRTAIFTPDDFDLLDDLIGRFTRVATTPNILTEVSNLAGQIRSDLKAGLFRVFSDAINQLEEEFVLSAAVAGNQEFGKFGLTDAVMILLAQKNYLVLTAEWPLSQYLQSQGMDVINFNHLRNLG